MKESDWVRSIEDLLLDRLGILSTKLSVSRATKLVYAHEIRAYTSSKPTRTSSISNEIDLLIGEGYGQKPDTDGETDKRIATRMKRLDGRLMKAYVTLQGQDCRLMKALRYFTGAG